MILLFPPALQSPAPISPPPLAVPSQGSIPASGPLRAQYSWGYVGAGGEGKGTLSLLLEDATGAVILELQGLGERLMLLKGDAAAGYRVQIPRQQVDATAASMQDLPIPFLPRLGGPAALKSLVAEGRGPGVKVTKRDGAGPVKLRYQGKDDQGKEVFVWLERKVWQPASAPAEPNR